jgi:hypothetical protein
MADPEPDNVSAVLDPYGTVVDTDPDGTHPANLLEMKGWMLGIGLEQFVVSVGNSLDGFR